MEAMVVCESGVSGTSGLANNSSNQTYASPPTKETVAVLRTQSRPSVLWPFLAASDVTRGCFTIMRTGSVQVVLQPSKCGRVKKRQAAAQVAALVHSLRPPRSTCMKNDQYHIIVTDQLPFSNEACAAQHNWEATMETRSGEQENQVKTTTEHRVSERVNPALASFLRSYERSFMTSRRGIVSSRWSMLSSRGSMMSSRRSMMRRRFDWGELRLPCSPNWRTRGCTPTPSA